MARSGRADPIEAKKKGQEFSTMRRREGRDEDHVRSRDRTITPGSGPSPASTDVVKSTTRASIDGTVFDSSIKRGQPPSSR